MVETTKNENTTLITPKERKGSYLDRGFPTGKALLVILGVVFFLQGISAWKIINLEREKASFEAERQNFHLLTQQLPDLQKTTSALEMKKLELQGDVDTLEKRKTMILGELKQFEQKANDLKSANEFTESRLKNTDNLLTERKAKCDELQAQQKKFNEEVSVLESKIKEHNFELNALQERVNKLRGEEKDIEVKIVRLETREDELRKLNTEFSSVIANLKSGSTEFTQYQNEVKISLKSATNALEDTTKTMRGSIAKIDHEVTNLKNSTDGFNQKQIAMAEIQNKFETAITKVENSAEGLSAGKLNIAAQTLEDATKNMRNSVTNLDQEVTNLTKSSIDLKNGVDQSTNNLKASVDQLSNVSTQSGKLLEGIVKELDSFQQKQVAIAEIQNRFATTLKQIESSAENFTSDKLGLQETYRKLKGEALDAIKKIEELRDVNLKLQKEFDGLRKTVNTLPRDEGVKATKQ